jgi:hypothetical protein
MRVSLRGLYPQYTFFSGRDIGVRQSDDGRKAQGRFGRGWSADKSMWRSDEIDAWLAAFQVRPQGRRFRGGDVNAAPAKREGRESK